jgi:hypothetical protein
MSETAKTLALLAQKSGLYSVERFRDEFNRKNFSVSVISPRALNPNHHYDFNLCRLSPTHTTSMEWFWAASKTWGTPLQPLVWRKKFSEKISQYEWLTEVELPALEPYLWFSSQDVESLFFQAWCRKWSEVSEGWIVKFNRGMQGRGLVHFDSLGALKNHLTLLETLEERDFLLQPFLKETQEYRCLIMEKKMSYIFKRQSEKMKLSANYFQGGKAHLVSLRELPSPIVSLFEKIENIFTLNQIHGLYAIDVLLDLSGRVWIIDVNANPGFEQMEKISQKNIVREWLEKLGF